MYEILLTREALQAYRKADRPLLKKLHRSIENLAADPYFHPNIKRLSGTLRGRFRYRVGNWRIVYQIDEANRQVNILSIVHRGTAYD